MAAMARRFDLDGTISAAGFASGDRFVVGIWPVSPLGPMADVMWVDPDGRRTLLAPDGAAAAFVASVYRFDDVVVDPFRWDGDGRRTRVCGGRLELDLEGGAGVALPVARPCWVTRHIEAPLARALLGVSTYGVSPTGVQEWYRALGLRRVVRGRAALDGRDLGALAPVDPPVGVGFSEPPRRPSIVRVRPRLVDPLGAVQIDNSLIEAETDRSGGAG